jgi:acyl-CoA synthetase (AMP-forming)/AMP-acid ligase II
MLAIPAIHVAILVCAETLVRQDPRFVWFVERLPLSSTNKVDRAALIREAQARLAASA